MYYIFNKEGQCVGSCDCKPDMDDLATRRETIMEVEPEQGYEIDRIILEQGKIKEKPPAPTVPDVPVEPYTDPERLAAFEAMAAQEARLVAQGERIAALEAELSALKGGGGK